MSAFQITLPYVTVGIDFFSTGSLDIEILKQGRQFGFVLEYKWFKVDSST